MHYRHALLSTLGLLFIAGCDQGLPRKESKTFTPIAEGIRQAKTLTLYEGVPLHLTGRFKPGEKPPQSDMVEVGKHLFYSTPLAPATDTVEALRHLCASEGSYLPYEAKKCGFHADFCMQWKEGGRDYRVIVCFGCDDVSVQGPDDAVLMTLRPTSVQQFTALLNPLRRHHLEAAR
jgi:hypothetical protein